MQITIHRATQIGGQITRISTANTNIIIDLGHNLPKNTEFEDIFDNCQTITELTKNSSAILYTHYHGDHIGLFHHVPKNIPQYIGEIAKQIVCRKYKQLCLLNNVADKQKYLHALNIASGMYTFHEKQVLQFGDITVTPYFISHSAYDAYMFLIEAEGKRVLHTGDFRGHGYLSKGLLSMIRTYIGQVDILIIEGTMLNRNKETILTETALSHQAAELMKKHKYVFVHCSSTDMERLASFKNATRAMSPHRPILADDYQKEILNLYSASAGKKKSSCFKFGTIYTYKNSNNTLKEWMLKNGFTMFIRANKKFHLLLDQILTLLPNGEEPLLIYSLWDGYLNRDDTKNGEYIKLQERFTNVKHLHTSGHATTEMLRKVCELTAPRIAILPIHREKGTDFSSIGISHDLQKKIITKDCILNDNVCIKIN